MKIHFIRHGMTPGNALKQYIGTTDEPLSIEGREQIIKYVAEGRYPQADLLIHTGMKRTIETAEIIYPQLISEAQCITGLQECNFGSFEGKNYQQLSGNPEYQQWIDSNGTLPFPKGESQESFEKRITDCFLNLVTNLPDHIENLVCCVHGGTIMAILHSFDSASNKHQINGKSYYDYMCHNGDCISRIYKKDNKKGVELIAFDLG